MTTITTTGQIKILRNRTKLSISACSEALKESNGDIEAAITYLKTKGMLDMMGGKDKQPTEGVVISYIHPNNRIGVLLEVNCQTDFVARTTEFKQFCKDIAMQIAGNAPPAEYVDEKDIDRIKLTDQYELFVDKTIDEKGFPKNLDELSPQQKTMVEKVALGRLAKWKKDICLLSQKFIKDPTKDINALLAEIGQSTGEQIVIRRFTRYELGEGLTKNKSDFAEEVKKQIDGPFKRPAAPADPKPAKFE